MLSLMRKHAGSWLIKLILGAVVVVFVLWGVGSWTSQRSGRVATVNGDPISLEEFRITYKRLLEQVRQSFGNNLNEDLIKTLQLPKQAMDELINRNLMRQAAAELHLQVSDEELSRSIQDISAFQTAGVFDSRRYQTILDRNSMTPESFETNQRDALMIQKLNNIITSSVKISDQEVVQWYKWDNTEVDLDFVFFDPERYQDISTADEEMQTYFEDHKESYKNAPKIKVRYLKFEPKTFVSQVVVSDDEIEVYYEDHPDEFHNPKTVEARHILIKLNQDASPEEVAKAKERIEAVLQKAKDGQDFAELAKENSEDSSKDKGGYLGTFKRDAMVKPFSEKAFSMKAGELSDPVRTRFGWHIIKVEKVNEATTTSFADAKSDILQKLTDEGSKHLAYDAAESVYDAAFEGADLEAIAADRNLTIQTPDYFSRAEPPKVSNNPAKFAATAFELPDGEISEIQDFGDGYYIMEIVEKLPAQIPELNEVKEKIRADLIKQKKGEKAKADAEAMLSALKDGETMDAAARKFDLEPKSTGFFKRNASIPDIGSAREISRVAFELTAQNSLPEGALTGPGGGYYVIKFKDRKIPSLTDIDKEKADIKARLLQQKKFRAFDEWLNQLRNRSEISIEEGVLES
ncbi:MAG: SurA N-terminal domain-containing protein [Desulfobacterales bacterium]